MKKIICIGEMLIDMIDVEKQGLAHASLYRSVPGGAAANVAIATARLESPVYFFGNLGADTFGNMLFDVLKDNKVGVEHVSLSKSTTVAWVGLTAEGERSFEFMRGSDGDYCLNHQAKEEVDSQTILHFGSATALLGGALEESYFELLKVGIEKNSYISFDPNYRDTLIQNPSDFIEKCMYFIERADFVKMSEEELELLSNTMDIEDGLRILRQKTTAIVCITRGAKGSLISIQDKLHHVASVRIRQVDATGAGDAFVGAVLSQLSKGFTDYVDIVHYANKAGAFTASRLGAIPSLPTCEEIEQFSQ